MDSVASAHACLLSRTRATRIVAIGGLCLALGVVASADDPRPEDVQKQGRTVAEALASFHLTPGLRIECAAAEPLVEDPIAFEWSADGRLWVVEMGDYPLGEDGKGKPCGKVRILTDDDGDGRYDRATVFLDGLSFPNSVAPHRDGVLIACSPDILFARDRDGDGRADDVVKLYSGFLESNPQHRANGFAWGLDGWWHGADGDSDHGIVAHKTGRRYELHGRDFRIHPDSGGFALETVRGQFGRQRDDWGNWFTNNNSVWAWHNVLPDAALVRNPALAVAAPTQVLEHSRKLFPTSTIVARFNDLDNAGLATSANSPSPYRDTLLGESFRTSLFVSEPVHNLVHRVVVEPAGSTYTGRRAPEEQASEFLSSSDPWFRPTQIKTGPDGSVWVADMYRAVIEHPEWIPDDWEARLDLRAGHDQGRIYRIFLDGHSPRKIPNLSVMNNQQLVAALDSPNGWQRDTAMRLLVERGAVDAVADLQGRVRAGALAQTRLQALATLDCLGRLEPADLEHALADPEPEVVRFAAETSGKLANQSNALADRLAGLVDHPSPRVRMGLALGLADWRSPTAARLLAQLIVAEPVDPWVRTAALSSVAPLAPQVLGELLAMRTFDAIPGPVLDAVLPLVFRQDAENRAELARLIRSVTDLPAGGPQPGQMRSLTSLLRAAERSGFDLGSLPEPDRAGVDEGLARLLAAARAWAVDAEREPSARIDAVRLLGRAPSGRAESCETLRDLLLGDPPHDLRRAGIEALAQLDPEGAAPTLLANWKSLSPATRDETLAALTQRPATVSGLLLALEEKSVPRTEIPPSVQRFLTEYRDPALRDRARAVFEAGEHVSREDVLGIYRSGLGGSQADAAAGKAVFARVCAACHRLEGVGVDVGPDLATLTDRSPEAMLVAILDPNRAFESIFAEYVVGLNDGRLLAGRVVAESGNALTLRQTGGKDETLLRSDIAELASTGRSLMPEGLEREITPEQFRDLVRYLGKLDTPRPFVGNRPELCLPRDDGTIALPASRAALYGSNIAFETEFQNLGYWSGADDRALWSFDNPRAGEFRLWMRYACDSSMAGNTFAIEVGRQTVKGRIEPTGSWATYQWLDLGTVRLEPGRLRLVVQPDGPPQGALLDLQSLELRPVPSE